MSRLNGRLTRLEKQTSSPADTQGRIIWAYEFPDPDAWEAAKAEHYRRWPRHRGIRFIDDVSFRQALHGERTAV